MPNDLLTQPARAFAAESIGPRSPSPLGAWSRHASLSTNSVVEPPESGAVVAVDFSRKSSAPNPLLAREWQADAQRVAGLVEQARALTTFAPDSPAAAARLAATLLSAQEPEEAVAAARRALELCAEPVPGVADMPAVLTAVRVLGDQGLYEEAEDYLGRPEVAGKHDYICACLMASLAAAQQKFELALMRLQGLTDPVVRELRGYLLLEVGQFPLALRELRAARLVLADTRSLLGNMAYAYAALGGTSKAIKTARQAWLLAPESLRAALDLAFYLTAGQRPRESVALLETWQRRYGGGQASQAVLVSKVNARLALGDVSAAMRELQDALASRVVSTDPTTRAETAGNIEYLRWRKGETSRGELITRVRKFLVSCNNQSLGLATMLADVSRSTAAHSEVAHLYEELLSTHDEKALLPLRTRLYAIACDAEGQLRAAEEWSRSSPLDPDPLATVVYLRGPVFGDHAAAATIGEKAVLRFPGRPLLLNNAAYALALAGRTEKAWRVIEGAPQHDPYITATRGLIRLLTGDVAGGIDDYKAAIARSLELAPDPDEAADFRRQVPVELLLLSHEADIPEQALRAFPPIGLPPAWRSMHVWRALELRARRLGIAWPLVS